MGLSDNQKSEFFKIARLLGHDQKQLLSGKEVCTYMHAPTLQLVAKMITRSTLLQRKQRSKTFFDNIISRQRLGQGVHDRIEASVFANEKISEDDQIGLQNVLPIPIMAISVLNKKIGPGQTWDLSVRGNRWNYHDLIDLYVIVNIGTLHLEEKSSILIRGNILSLICQQFSKTEISENNTSVVNKNFDIGILPTPFFADGTNEISAIDLNGKNGQHGDAGKVIQTGKSIFGPYLIGDSNGVDTIGKPGTKGEDGKNCSHGRNGGPSKLAELTFRVLKSNIIVFGQAGKGEDGGNGGHGGQGGVGGQGTSGIKTLTEEFADGNGGNGGDGGSGGDGGNGGNGGISSNIYINVTKKDEYKVKAISLAGEGGIGGLPGNRGKGGVGGNSPNNYLSGKNGNDGKNGKKGKNGKSRNAPQIYVRDQKV
jgi:hypothetical protein